MERNLTGAYLRVMRDGKALSLDISDMTVEEIKKALDGRTAEELIGWVVMLAQVVRKLGDAFDIVQKFGEEI